ncbi:nickel pincer cofactor biosynthesis protein LarB [Paracoccus sp. M683]|uniref:nickel pincer cofactor biosynthesis protein LarB n=1 Tax=Paracoccus sp. M683 TaxID=2594268 RepID=UPI001180B263|nr:nickel pincer cofactor biosynthesis protein LarB [Paracoccus sp. M683]TRW96538.1 nickel pincer cofactor biosynthesis protein LarB [Paracoccus sp. M683]
MDWQRRARTGIPEAVFCEGKTPDHIRAILTQARDRQARLFLTRLTAPAHDALAGDFALDYCPLSRTAVFGGWPQAELRSDQVALVSAGTSDMPVVEEARRALAFHGIAAPVFADIGVAGLWRLMDAAEELARFRVLIAVAGMEGALFSALAGLVPGVVIAVPSPVGYGVSAGGQAALTAALASCAPGVLAVNIGNGFGAAAAACKIIG